MARLADEVEEQLRVADERREPLRVAHVEEVEPDVRRARPGWRGCRRAPARASRRGRAPQPASDEAPRQVRADEPRAAGDEHASARGGLPRASGSERHASRSPSRRASACADRSPSGSCTTGTPRALAARISARCASRSRRRAVAAEIDDARRHPRARGGVRSSRGGLPPSPRAARLAPGSRARPASSLEQLASRAFGAAGYPIRSPAPVGSSARRTGSTPGSRSATATAAARQALARRRRGCTTRRSGVHVDRQAHAAAEPAHVLVDEVELEDPRARPGRRRRRRRGRRRSSPGQTGRGNARSQTVRDDELAGCRPPAIARPDLR